MRSLHGLLTKALEICAPPTGGVFVSFAACVFVCVIHRQWRLLSWMTIAYVVLIAVLFGLQELAYRSMRR